MTKDETTIAYKCADLYYRKFLTQAEIARRLQISRPKVSRLLSLARNLRMVSITVNPPEFFDQTWLSNRIIAKYNLKKVFIGIPEGSTEPVVRRTIGTVFQDNFKHILGEKRSIGIGWGTTVHEMIMNLKGSISESKVTILPILGGAAQSEPAYQVNNLVDVFANWLNAKRMYLMAPAMCESPEQKRSFSCSSSASSVVKEWENLQMAVFGLGKPIGESDVLNSTLPKEYIIELVKNHAIGDILARFFDSEGKMVCHDIEEILLGISFKQLLNVPERVCLAGGEGKILGMRTALNAGYITTLVTDQHTAQALIRDP
jgi:DNA-binding transcriptional regulator LsrR (DeoR family)